MCLWVFCLHACQYATFLSGPCRGQTRAGTKVTWLEAMCLDSNLGPSGSNQCP